MAIADFFNPQPQGQPGQGSTVEGWKNWVQSPQGRATLIQFGANLSQPMGIGQNTLGHVGRAVAGGFEASDRTTAAQIELERQEQERQDRLARDQQQQSQFATSHGLREREFEAGQPLREAQTARQMRLATQPPTGASGAAWGPASRQLQALRNNYSRYQENAESDVMRDLDEEPILSFEEYAAQLGETDLQGLVVDAQAERAAYQARFGAQAQPGQPQPQAGQPQPQPAVKKSAQEILGDPSGQDIIQMVKTGLSSSDPRAKQAAEEALERIKAFAINPDELERSLRGSSQPGGDDVRKDPLLIQLQQEFDKNSTLANARKLQARKAELGIWF